MLSPFLHHLRPKLTLSPTPEITLSRARADFALSGSVPPSAFLGRAIKKLLDSDGVNPAEAPKRIQLGLLSTYQSVALLTEPNTCLSGTARLAESSLYFRRGEELLGISHDGSGNCSLRDREEFFLLKGYRSQILGSPLEAAQALHVSKAAAAYSGNQDISCDQSTAMRILLIADNLMTLGKELLAIKVLSDPTLNASDLHPTLEARRHLSLGNLARARGDFQAANSQIDFLAACLHSMAAPERCMTHLFVATLALQMAPRLEHEEDRQAALEHAADALELAEEAAREDTLPLQIIRVETLLGQAAKAAMKVRNQVSGADPESQVAVDEYRGLLYQAAHIVESHLPESHWINARVCLQLGVYHSKLEDTFMAGEYFSKAHRTAFQALGSEHPLTKIAEICADNFAKASRSGA